MTAMDYDYECDTIVCYNTYYEIGTCIICNIWFEDLIIMYDIMYDRLIILLYFLLIFACIRSDVSTWMELH